MTTQQLKDMIFKCRIEINSPYNDGWTKDFYQQELNKALEQLNKIGTQLELEYE